MSTITGESNLQATQISAVTTDLSGLQTQANTTQSTLSSYITTNDAAVGTLSTQRTNLHNSLEAYKTSNNSAVGTINSTLSTYTNTNDNRLTTLENEVDANYTAFTNFQNDTNSDITGLVSTFTNNRDAFDTFVTNTTSQLTSLGGDFSNLNTRVTTLEGHVSTIQNDINTTIQNDIESKIATLTFDQVKQQLMNTDTALSNSLATKIAKAVQVPVDTEQANKINHLIDFVNVFLQTYTINQDGTPYQFTTSKITLTGEGYGATGN